MMRRSARTATRPRVHFKDVESPWFNINGMEVLQQIESAASKSSRSKRSRPAEVKSKIATEQDAYTPHRRRIQSLLSKYQLQQTLQDAWQNSGFQNRQEGRIIDEKTLARSQEEVSQIKQQILQVLHHVQHSTDHLNAVEAESDGIHYNDFTCCICHSKDDTEDNELLICDGHDCQRCYHQNCCKPIVDSEEKGGEDDDWFCRRCLCLGDCLRAINEVFECDFDTVEDLAAAWSLENAAVVSVAPAISASPASKIEATPAMEETPETTGRSRRKRPKVDYLTLNLIYYGESILDVERRAQSGQNNLDESEDEPFSPPTQTSPVIANGDGTSETSRASSDDSDSTSSDDDCASEGASRGHTNVFNTSTLQSADAEDSSDDSDFSQIESPSESSDTSSVGTQDTSREQTSSVPSSSSGTEK